MLRKMLLGAVALIGLTFVGTQSADAGWRRAARRGYYNSGYYNGAVYAPRRVYRQRYYAPPVVYANPGYGYYGYNNGYPGYYGGSYGYSPGVGVVTPGFGFYVR
jgi:hypothetical protein